MRTGIQDITVISKTGEHLRKCTSARAFRLVGRGCAVWDGRNRIKMLLDREDKRIMRKKVIEVDNRICYICNEEISVDLIPTIDHVIPKSPLFFGKERISNMKCCCKRCNDDKANMDIRQYVNHIGDNRERYYYISDNQLKKLIVNSNNYYTN